MKKEELTALGLTLEQAKAVLAINGRDIEKHKAAAEELKLQAEQAKTAAQQKIDAIRFDSALDSALLSARAKSTKAVRALLDTDRLSMNDGHIDGLSEQLDALRAENAFLFEGSAPDFEIVKPSPGAHDAPSDAFIANARLAAGLQPF